LFDRRSAFISGGFDLLIPVMTRDGGAVLWGSAVQRILMAYEDRCFPAAGLATGCECNRLFTTVIAVTTQRLK
jgi:hypothetical protein